MAMLLPNRRDGNCQLGAMHASKESQCACSHPHVSVCGIDKDEARSTSCTLPQKAFICKSIVPSKVLFNPTRKRSAQLGRSLGTCSSLRLQLLRLLLLERACQQGFGCTSNAQL